MAEAAAGHAADPLVAAYRAAQGEDCAWRVWQPRWALAGFVLAVLAAAASGLAWGRPTPLAVPVAPLVQQVHLVFGDPLAVHAGMLAAMLVATLPAARRRPAAVQEAWLGVLAAAVLHAMLYDPLIGLGLVLGGLALCYLASLGLRLAAMLIGRPPPPAAASDPPQWPSYTVLVPLYREPEVAGGLLAALAALDYPRERLQGLLLIEHDDAATRAALEGRPLPPWLRIHIVPPGEPRTKPRACNHGLAQATGELLVVYDAEDRPEPDQLRRAARAFAAADPRIACLQARLVPHNAADNALTAWFAIDYALWFSRFLPGLARLGLPVPLGGTSNHFRTAVLRALGGWDPWNVTEDCDLGLRLHAAGWRTQILDAVTWEEAPSRLGPWLRQRARWLKGYLVTHWVWWRRPWRTIARLGPWSALAALCLLPCATLLPALALPLWALTLGYAGLLVGDVARGFALADLLTQRQPLPLDPLSAAQPWSWPLLYFGPDEDPLWSRLSLAAAGLALLLVLGNAWLVLLACRWGHGGRPWRGWRRAALSSPLSWALVSLAAWRALWDFVRRPHHWHKTPHGLSHAAGAHGAQRFEPLAEGPRA